MEKNPTCPLLVGRGFLATVSAVIDCKKSKIAVGEGVTRSRFGVKEIGIGHEDTPYYTTRARRKSYELRHSTNDVGAQPSYYLEKDFMNNHVHGEWEIVRDESEDMIEEKIIGISHQRREMEEACLTGNTRLGCHIECGLDQPTTELKGYIHITLMRVTGKRIREREKLGSSARLEMLEDQAGDVILVEVVAEDKGAEETVVGFSGEDGDVVIPHEVYAAMITTEGFCDTNREVPVNETFHVQTDDELTKKELRQIEADDQSIQTILLGLPEDIYVAVDSCETA
nr:hypothetical protein [Tanacetum cinerariifolium]